ncbi:hypothetical protein KKH26_01305 [Patescibacteria group bacterium]|nr:hypothetical protein [Patescibacteria group bacterium]
MEHENVSWWKCASQLIAGGGPKTKTSTTLPNSPNFRIIFVKPPTSENPKGPVESVLSNKFSKSNNTKILRFGFGFFHRLKNLLYQRIRMIFLPFRYNKCG